jgi:hypothetical protein
MISHKAATKNLDRDRGQHLEAHQKAFHGPCQRESRSLLKFYRIIGFNQYQSIANDLDCFTL